MQEEQVIARHAGLGPVPNHQKRISDTGQNFLGSDCNRKVIGAKYFMKGYELYMLSTTKKPLNESLESRSPRDTEGHGSHMVSTVVGSAAPNASLYEVVEGTARGMAPKAWLAIYKVCWLGGQCFGSNIVAGFD